MCMYVHCTCMDKAISNFLDRILVLDFLELAQPEAPPDQKRSSENAEICNKSSDFAGFVSPFFYNDSFVILFALLCAFS